MHNKLPSAAGVLIVAAVIATTAIHAYQAPPLDDASAVASLPLPTAAEPSATSSEWPSYKKTLTSERFSPLNQINALIGTTEHDIFSINFNSGRRVWATTIGDSKLGGSTPAARITLNGFVFIGNAGGDSKGVKGRMYALNARTGEIIWEFYLLPKSVDDQARGPQRATWTSYTLDPVTGELFVSGGNPGPGLATGMREGANLYSGSVIALNTRTGICTASTSAPIHCGIVYR